MTATKQIKVPYRVVDGVRLPYATPWGALEKGDHVMLWLPPAARVGDEDVWDRAWGDDARLLANNVFVLAEAPYLHITPASAVPDDPEDAIVAGGVWCVSVARSYVYQEGVTE